MVLALGVAARADLAAAQAIGPEQGDSLEGAYTFLKDSDGKPAPENVKIMLTFSAGSAVLVSTPPQPLYTDSGTYEYQAGTLKRFVLPRLGKFVANGKVEFGSDAVTLPFKLLSSGPGTSSWLAPKKVNRASESIQPLIDQILKEAEREIPPKVRSILQRSITPREDEAEQYLRVGTSVNAAGHIPEAIWALAHSAKISEDPQALNNLAHALSLDAEYANARQLLLAARASAPGNPIILNNLAYTNYQMGKLDEAELAERLAVAADPQPEYLWSLCKILHAQKRAGEARPFCDQAMEKGILAILHPGSGKSGGDKEGPGPKPEGPPGPEGPPPPDEPNGPEIKPPKGNEDEGMENAPEADPDSSIIGQIGKRDRANDQKPPKPYEFPSNPKPLREVSRNAAEWVGHWEGYKATGCIHRTRKFGEGLSMTQVKENICHYAQKLSLDVGEDGRIHGEGEALYVFYGKADNYAAMMLPLPLPPGGFFATFPGGYRTRKFKVEGVVTPSGTVYIGGRPEKPMYLLNVYMFQKIYGWNVFPPPVNDPAKPGILQIGKKGSYWTMEGGNTNAFSGMKYETLIYKTNTKFEMVKGCKIYCQEKPVEVKPTAKLDEVKCNLSAGPVKVEGNGQDVSLQVDAGPVQVGADKEGVSSVGVKAGGASVSVSRTEASVGMDLGMLGFTAGANYGKPGELQKMMQLEAKSGCATGFETEVGKMSAGMSAGMLGFSNERNPISGDETFTFSVGASAKGPGGKLGALAAKSGLEPSLKLMVNSRCGIGMRFSVMGKGSAEASGSHEVDGMKVGGGCSKGGKAGVTTTVWAASNITD